MINPLAASAFLGVWASLYLADSFLRSHPTWGPIYTSKLLRWGLSIHILQARWYTSRFNRFFHRVAQSEWFPWRLWFNLGVIFGLISMLASVALLSLLAFNTLMRKPIEQQILTPVMPGVNLPMSQLGFYLLTLLVCGIVHEFGHAIAAVRERTRVNGFGLFVLGVYPGAFVDLSTPDLQCLSGWRQLRIYCAGVWHNFVVVLLGICLLHLLPLLLCSIYSVGSGVGVVYLRENSVVTGRRGLYLGDAITSVNSCPVTSLSQWLSCLDSATHAPPGYCLATGQVKQLDVSGGQRHRTLTDSIDCCLNQSSTHICFTYKTKTFKNRYACLPARTVTDRPSCVHTSDCYQPHSETACVKPSLDNRTALIRIQHSRRPPILFLGDVRDLLYSVGVSDYVPRWSMVPLSLPYVLDTLAKYLISLSGALALLNVVPCYALDGQWILGACIDLTLPRLLPDPKARSAVFKVGLFLGTLLLLLNLFLALWFLFFSSAPT